MDHMCVYIGSVYYFTLAGGMWSKQSKLIANDGLAYDCFGRSVSLNISYAFIGAFNDDSNGTVAC